LAFAPEQWLAHVGFNQPDLMTDRGLCHSQFAGGGGEIFMPCCGFKNPYGGERGILRIGGS
jgi:hypothetical protein